MRVQPGAAAVVALPRAPCLTLASAQPSIRRAARRVVPGEAAVGKSSLVLRFTSNEFQENKEPTIGAAFLAQKCEVGDRTIKFEVWDTAGQERFHSLAPMYYRNAQAAIVVYDITNKVRCICATARARPAAATRSTDARARTPMAPRVHDRAGPARTRSCAPSPG